MTDQSISQFTRINYKAGLVLPAIDMTAPPGLKNVGLLVDDMPGAGITSSALGSLPPAAAAADGDTLPVSQGGNLLVQTFLAIWTYIQSKLQGYRKGVVSITGNTALTAALHNNSILVCAVPCTLTAAWADTGLGFTCDIINLSSGNITMGSGITVGNGTPSLSPGGAAHLQGVGGPGGNVVYWAGVAIASTAATLTVAAIGAHTPNTAFTVTGAYFNDAPTALDYSTNGGASWTAAPSPTIANGAFSFSVAGGLAAGTYTLQVRDHNAQSVVGVSNSFTVAVSNQISISAPGTATVGTAFAITGSIAPTADGAQIALGTSATTAPTSGFVAATNTAGAVTGQLTATAAGTLYAWLKDATTGLTAVSGQIVVSVANTLTVSAPSTGNTGVAIGISGSVSPSSDGVQIALGTSNTSAPTTGWLSAGVTSGTIAGSLTAASAGTYYAFAKDTLTGLTAVSGAITVTALSANVSILSTIGPRQYSIVAAIASAQSFAGEDIACTFAPASGAAAFSGGATVNMYWSESAPTAEPTPNGTTILSVGALTGAIGPLFTSGNIACYAPRPPSAGTWYLSLFVDNDGSNNGGFVLTPIVFS